MYKPHLTLFSCVALEKIINQWLLGNNYSQNTHSHTLQFSILTLGDAVVLHTAGKTRTLLTTSDGSQNREE